jgi:hypothetical protein
LETIEGRSGFCGGRVSEATQDSQIIFTNFPENGQKFAYLFVEEQKEQKMKQTEDEKKSPLDGDGSDFDNFFVEELVERMSDYDMDNLLLSIRNSGKVVLPFWFIYEDLNLGGITEEQFFASMSDVNLREEIKDFVFCNTIDEIERMIREYQPEVESR